MHKYILGLIPPQGQAQVHLMGGRNHRKRPLAHSNPIAKTLQFSVEGTNITPTLT